MARFALAFAYYVYNTIVTRVPAYGVRHWYLRTVFGVRLGPGSSIHMGCFVTGGNITIGKNSVVNRNCFLDGRAGIDIGDNASISAETCIITLGHDPRSPDFSTTGEKVVIGDYAWIGMRALILPGVRLGRGCIAGAGSVVTKSFDDFSIVAGNPAKKIGQRPTDLRYDPRYFPYFNTDLAPQRAETQPRRAGPRLPP